MASLESSSYWWSVTAVVLAGLTALSGIFAWYFTDKLASRRKTDFETFAEQSKTETARLNERAANFEKEAADSMLEVQRLKEKLSWREISPKEKQDFIDFVEPLPKGKVSITHLTNNEEVAAFTLQLAEMLRQAGYDAPATLNEMYPMMPFGLMVGVVIIVKDPQDQVAAGIQKGLEKIGITAPAQLQPDRNEPGVTLSIGSKPSK
jgi:hypothetical protein